MAGKTISTKRHLGRMLRNLGRCRDSQRHCGSAIHCQLDSLNGALGVSRLHKFTLTLEGQVECRLPKKMNLAPLTARSKLFHRGTVHTRAAKGHFV